MVKGALLPPQLCVSVPETSTANCVGNAWGGVFYHDDLQPGDTSAIDNEVSVHNFRSE